MNALQTHFWAVRDYLSPVLRASKFKEHGRITPDEFVAAGDFLSYKFPTWQWCSGDAAKARNYLPSDKQFLISQGIPSLRRVSDLEGGAGSKVHDDDEKLMSFAEAGSEDADGDQWVATHFDSDAHPGFRTDDMEDIPDIGEDMLAPGDRLTDGQADALAARITGIGLHEGDTTDRAADTSIGDMPDMADIPDMDDELDDFGTGVEEQDDPSTAVPAHLNTVSSAKDFPDRGNKLLSVRKYDCIITYDKYYQTPRMWLVGYDEHGIPLRPAQIFEDVSSDYAQKTVTIEPFPHGYAGPDASATTNTASTGVATASIHPCKHASVMKKVIERMNASVIEGQKKAAEANPNTGEAKKKKGWSVSGAVKRVTGSTQSASAPSAPTESSTEESAEVHTEIEGLRVDQYLIIFLKFMASIVPAIEIDATQAL